MNRVAKKIKEARAKAKMTEKELAKKCGLSVSYIIQIESGKKVVNEKVAEKILKVLGEKLEFLNQEDSATQKSVDTGSNKKKVENKPKEQFYNIKPTEQWSDALANIIKTFPIYEVSSNKVVGHKELPILNKKIEGYNWEKILFVKSQDNVMEAFRIKKNDVIMVQLTNEIQNGSIYLIEMNNKRMIRQLQKKPSKKVMIITEPNENNSDIRDLNKIKVIGKCVKVEFNLNI